MHPLWHAYIGWLVGAAALAVGTAAFTVRRRDRPGAVPLAGLALGAGIWSAAAALELASPALGAKVFWGNLVYVGVVVVPAAFLLFTLEYTGREGWVTRRTVALLAVEPTLVVVLVWSGAFGGLFLGAPSLETAGSIVVLARDRGPAFWAHTAYSYVLLVAGAAVMAEHFLLSDHLYRSQADAILVAVFAPWLGNALYLTGLVHPGVDPTPFAFVVSGLALTWAVFRYELLDLLPVTREVARRELIASIEDAVVIVDERRRIADLNPPARDLATGSVSAVIGRPVDEVFPTLAAVLGEDDTSPPERAEVRLVRDGATHYYDVRISALAKRVALGHLVILRDVTDRERHRQRLEVLNRVLRHDLRNDINVMIALAEDIVAVSDDPDGMVVDRARRITQKGLDLAELSEKARDLERTIARDDATVERLDLAAVAAETARAVVQSYPDAVVETDLSDAAPVRASELLDSAIANLLRNAIEHNDRPTPRVTLSVSVADENDVAVLAVADDGPGIPDAEREVLSAGRETPLQHSSGMGLWLINWIVAESDGRISFEENEPRGTVVRVELPAADPAAPGATAEPPPDGAV